MRCFSQAGEHLLQHLSNTCCVYQDCFCL